MIKQIIILLFFILLEIPKRLLSLWLYPYAYQWRKELRTKEILWATYLFKSKFKPLWFFLDDSIFMEQGKEYDDKEKRYPALLWKWHKDFLLAWWWSGIRNSCVNWNNSVAFKLGHKLQCMKKWGGKNSFVELRLFAHGKKRLYTEFFIGSKWFQFGFISCGRFEIDLLKDREKK